MMTRREGNRTGTALAVSLVLHAAALAAMAVTSGPPRPPKDVVFAVDIVSAPPNVAGEKMAEEPATQEPGAADPQPQPAAEPAPPDPTPPAPDPVPPAPRPEPAKEPAKAREPRREPERPVQRPPTPAPQSRPAQTPPRPQPQTPPRPNAGAQSGQGTQPNRTQGQGTRTGPATGPNARPDAAGGEGLIVRREGEPCPVQGFCENVERQVNRFFRPPGGTAGATGEVCFRILRDGSVGDIDVPRARGGGPAFRLALREAAEQAGNRRAFGALPSAFDPARWRWCVELSPS